MELLLRQPLLNLHDVPHMVSLSNLGEEYHKEVLWILNVLEAGLKTEKVYIILDPSEVSVTDHLRFLGPRSISKTECIW